MTDFFRTIKDFVVKYQTPAGLQDEIMGIGLVHFRNGYTVEIEPGKCTYSATVSEDGVGKMIVGHEQCNNLITYIRDENGDGEIDAREAVTVRNPWKGKNSPHPNASAFYQSFQKRFQDEIAKMSELERFFPPPSLKGANAVLIAGPDILEIHQTLSTPIYLHEALEKTKTILEKVQPSLKEAKGVTFVVHPNATNFGFVVEEKNVPAILLPPDPKQGGNVLIGFILMVLNIPQDRLDKNGQRAIEMFTAFVEMKKSDFSWLVNYYITEKIYPPNIVPMMEEEVLAKGEKLYQEALKQWKDDAFGDPTVTLLGVAKRELAKRPPTSGSDQSLAIDALAKKIDDLSDKIGRLKKLVDEKKTDEVVRFLKAEGLIHPEKVTTQTKDGNFSKIKITGVHWHQEGHLLLDVQFESDCGGHNRLQVPKTVTKPFALQHFRRLEEQGGYKYYINVGEETGCSEKKSSGVSLDVGWRGGEYTRFFSHGETLSGGPKFQWTSHYKMNPWGNESGFTTLGWAPLLRRLELGGGEMNQARAGSFGGGIKFSYQREEFEKDSPDNILKLGFDMRGRYYPFHSISHLDRFSIGFDADIGIAAGLAFKDGWLEHLQWVPIWAGIWAMAGVDF